MRFTRRNVATLALPAGRPYAIFWDDDLPGFGVRVNPTGRVWVVQYRTSGKSRRQTIGRTDTIALEAARENAKNTLARVQLGADPHSEKIEANARNALTFTKVTQRYLANAQSRLKPRSFQEVSRHFRKHWALFDKLPLQKIDKRLIAARLEEIATENGRFASNRARASLSALYSFALGTGLVDINPVIGTFKAVDETPRDHVLNDAEIGIIWNTCPPSDYGRIVRLLLLTGQRRDEVGSLTWPEVDLEKAMWSLAGNRTKNGRAHEIPLSDAAIKVIHDCPRLLLRDQLFGSGKGGYSGWSRSKQEFDLALTTRSPSFRPWRLHDLRRTVATGMATLGVAPHVVEAVLNHVSGSRAGVAGIYNRATYREEKRAALTLWSKHVRHLASQRD